MGGREYTCHPVLYYLANMTNETKTENSNEARTMTNENEKS